METRSRLRIKRRARRRLCRGRDKGVVPEHGRLRRPERFFAVFAHGAFPAEMHHAQKRQKGCVRGRASACTGLLPPQYVILETLLERIHKSLLLTKRLIACSDISCGPIITAIEH